jgi:predicted amidohydrolase
MRIVISLAQIDVALGDPDRNLTIVKETTAEAARRGSDIVIFPELWSTGYDLENAATHATPVDRGIFAETAELSRQFGIHIAGSCLSLMGEERYGNTAVLYDSQGSALGVYTKIHLFRLMEEDQYLVPGDHLTLAETRWGSLGLAICYDLRFPEIFRAYAIAGARMVLLPSEWPHPRLPPPGRGAPGQCMLGSPHECSVHLSPQRPTHPMPPAPGGGPAPPPPGPGK